jgi:ORF6N domain
MLDADLAQIYGVPPKRLNEQFRRNRKRFPKDFAFQLTAEEASSLRSQNAISSQSNRSQIAAATGTATDAAEETDRLPSVTDPGFSFPLSAFSFRPQPLNIFFDFRISAFSLSVFPLSSPRCKRAKNSPTPLVIASA